MALFILFAILTGIGFIAYGLQIVSVRKTLTAQGPSQDSGFTPPVSILKPLKGLDDKLFDNLESFCTQDYPEYEVLFALQDHNDPACKVARKVKERHPGKNISIIVESCGAGLNPKVNNLMAAYRTAKYEYILISDSNVSADRDYLRETARHMASADVGLVTNPIRGTGGRSLGSVFENLHLNSFILGSVCFLDRFLSMPCVIGKSMLLRKSDLEAIGGLKAFKDVLAEDYIIGKSIHESGKRVVLSGHVIANVNEYWGVEKFINRHTRWGKLRWKIGGAKYFSELIGNPVFMAVLPILLCGPSVTTLSLAAVSWLMKGLGDYSLGRMVGTFHCEKNAHMKTPYPLQYLLSPLKDIVIGLIWFVPLFSNTVVWRGNRYVVEKNSVLSPCPDTGLLALRYRFADAVRAKLA